MKKTYDRSQKSRKKNEGGAHESALRFLANNSNYASSVILRDLRSLDARQRALVERLATRSLRDATLKRNEQIRNGAVRLIVALLPKTINVLEKLLADRSSPLWYEVHFTAFSSLNRHDLDKATQDRVISLVERYLMTVKSQAGYAAWKAGDLLGDEWQSPETTSALERVILSAKHVAGRRAALHGIAHAIKKVKPSSAERLLSLLRKVASDDPSSEIRSYGASVLECGGCLTANN